MSAEIYYSRDGEMFNGECLEDLDLEIGDTYYFGESQEIKPSSLIPKFAVDELLERMDENLFDEVGELAEDRLHVSDEAKADLLEFMQKWADENVTVSCYKVINVKEAVFNGESK